MSKIKNRRWDVIVPVSSGFPTKVTNYESVATINAPTYERAIKEAEKIVEPYIDDYIQNGDSHNKEYDKRRYDARSKYLWRIREETKTVGTIIDKYV